MRRLWGICLLFLFMLLAANAQAAQEKRVALIIGNSAYRNVPRLDNPANDARLIATTLQGLGFTLVGNGAQLDLDRDHFVEALRQFRSSLSGGSIGVFYYAGHGLQVDGVNYLVPVDASPSKPSDVDDELIDANRVLRKMQDAGTSLNIVMLDACRNNPFRGPALRSSNNGLVEMQALEGTLISFATSPGTVADDGEAGANGPYALALATALPKPGLDVFQTFNEVNKLVYRRTGKRQQPWMSSSPIEGEFYFAGQQLPSLPSPAAPLTATAPTPPPAPLAQAQPSVTPSSRPAATTPPQTVAAAAAPPPPTMTASVAPIVAPAATPMVLAARTQPPAQPISDSVAPVAAPQPQVLVATLQAPAPTEAKSAANAHALDAAAWDKARSAGAAADFQSYLDQYPDGEHAGEARVRLEGLRTAAAASAPAPSAPADSTAAPAQTEDEVARFHACWDPYQQKNYADAMPGCRHASDNGDVIAMRLIGVMYDNAQGVPRDYAEAAKWYRQAAEKNDPDAANNLAVLYANGSGVPRDYVEALRWARMAAEKGNSAAAMHNVGYFYDNGWGVNRDYAEALRWYRMAADKGNVASMNDLGTLYGNGRGVERDYAEALRWYRLAAEKGNVNAMNNLGALYANGQGVGSDYTEALRWYRMAAEKGNVDAMNNIGVLYGSGKGVSVDYSEALRWFRLAADKGNAVALRNIGDLYRRGQGVTQDSGQARAWYQKAADLGDVEARGRLKERS